MNERILVADDDAQLRRALRVILRAAGYEPQLAADPEEALDAAALRMPDAALVDLRLGDTDGVELIRRLRAFSDLPIIVLSMVGDEADKVRALDAGADDYVTKPFGADELLARIRAQLRRSTTATETPIVEIGALRIDQAARRVSRAGRDVDLTPTEWRLVSLLLRHRGRVLTQRMILDEVWGSSYDSDHGYLVRQQVANLRTKLEEDPKRPTVVLTSLGVGYRFADP